MVDWFAQVTVRQRKLDDDFALFPLLNRLRSYQMGLRESTPLKEHRTPCKLVLLIGSLSRCGKIN